VHRHFPWGLTDPNGSCPWTGPWTGLHGAHLLCRFPRIDADTVVVASLSFFGGRPMPQASLNKTDLRRSALALRDALPASRRESAAKALAEQALFKAGGHIVSAYHAIGSEFDPKFLL
jgi:hypothetical protein